MANDNKSKGAFSDIETSEVLIEYLKSTDRRSNVHFLHHYTSLKVVVSIIQKKQWHLCSAKNMNDLLELRSGDERQWENKLFSSFMAEGKESIAMWSMYGQPWENGVKISIPKNNVHRWLNATARLNEVSTSNYLPTGRVMQVKKGSLRAIAVAYSNCHDFEDDGKEVLRWSNQSNDKCRIDPTNFGVLTGYIKNRAWEYEKEHRIMFDQVNDFDRGSIDIPEYIIDSMIITPSPLFEGDFLSELRSTIEQEVIHTEQSIFANKLNIRTICSACSLKTFSESVS